MAQEAEIASKTLEWAKSNSSVQCYIRWGKKSFTFVLKHNGHDHRPLAVFAAAGFLKVNFRGYRDLALSGSEEKLQEFLDHLKDEADTPIPASTEENTVRVDLTMLKNSGDQRRFFDALDWFVQEIKAT